MTYHSYNVAVPDGAPLREVVASEPEGHPLEDVPPQRALWRHVLDESFLSESMEVMPEAFPDNRPVFLPKAGRRR